MGHNVFMKDAIEVVNMLLVALNACVRCATSWGGLVKKTQVKPVLLDRGQEKNDDCPAHY